MKHIILNYQFIAKLTNVGHVLQKITMVVIPLAITPVFFFIPFNFRIITAIVASIFSFSLAFFVYNKNTASPAHRYFAFFVAGLGIWGLNELIIFLPMGNISLFLYRTSYIGGSFVVPFAMNFVYSLVKEVPGVNVKWKYKWGDYIVIIFACLSLSPLIIKGIVYNTITMTPVKEIPGIGYLLFAGVFITGLGYMLYMLYLGLHKAAGVKLNQLRYAMLAVVLGMLGGIIYFGYVINPKIPPLYYLFQIGVIIAFAVAIVRYHLMDISELSRDTLIYGSASVLLAVAFVSTGIWFAPHYPRAVFITTVVVLAVAIPVLHRYLRKLLAPVVDQSIFRGRFDYQKSLQNIGDKAFTIYSLKELLDTVVKDVAATLGADTCYALIREGRTDTFELWAEIGLDDELHDKCIKVEEGNDFIKALVRSKKVLVKEDMMVVSAEDSNKDVVKAMEERGCAIVVPLYFNEKLNGVLGLGPKNNRRMYTHKDVKLLEKLSRDVSHAYGFLSIIYEQALLTARTAHDAKQPLGGATGTLQQMLRGLYGPVPDQLREELQYVYTRNQFVSEFFSDLMQLNDMIRLRLRGEYTFEAYDMIETLDFIVHGLKSVAENKGLELRSRYPANLPKGMGVSKSVLRCLSNLVSNSIKFTEKGFVDVSARVDGEYIEVKITDTGSGMSEDDVKNLFVPFHKIGGRINFVDGAGLGLTIVKEVLDAHKGKIKVESKLDQGTEFTVLLPCEASI